MNTICQVIPSSIFDYDAATNTFSCDASQLRGAIPLVEFMRRVWGDSCDEGFVMRSVKTGKEVIFTGTEHRRDGDISHWTFETTLHQQFYNSRLVGCTVTIWNT